MWYGEEVCVCGCVCVYTHTHTHTHTRIHKYTIDSPYLAALLCQTKHIAITTGVDRLDI